MSRQARESSPTGIYHVMTRGIDRSDLFIDDSDRSSYKKIVAKAKDKYPFFLHAYCLMGNHVHLLIEEREVSISLVMKSIGIRYSMFFNKRYGRIGNLHQGRFRSEAIATERQFQVCAAYIHNNPVKAGLKRRPEAYPWSSIRGYLTLAEEPFLDKDRLLALHDGPEGLLDFTGAAGEKHFTAYGYDDDERKEKDADRLAVEAFLAEHCRIELLKLPLLPRTERKTAIKAVKGEFSLSCRRLAAILNVSKDAVYRA